MSGLPALLGLFQKRIEGDDSLWELARLRFAEAGLGPELYAETPKELERVLAFCPEPAAAPAVHLPRDLDLLSAGDRARVLAFAARFAGRVSGLVVHDQEEIRDRSPAYLAALGELDRGLGRIGGSPRFFLEYAVGLEPERYLGLLRAAAALEGVSACLDIGHLGLWHARRVYAATHPGTDVCSLRPRDPALPDRVEDVQTAVRSGLGAVLEAIRALGAIEKPVHFHLHDGHPLSTLNPLGISDHLSFLEAVPIPFLYRGKASLEPMFGPGGLRRVVAEALRSLGPAGVTLSLEIHPAEGRLPLEEASGLFGHWKDKGNAERMSYWLSVLAQNARLLADCLREAVGSCDAEEKSLPPCRGTTLSLGAPMPRASGVEAPREEKTMKPRKILIYNLFPLLAGPFPRWRPHLERASRMGFNWVFVNPIQRPGLSGSLYAIKDYFDLNPLLVDGESEAEPRGQVKEMIRAAKDLGLSVLVDLVINHCAVDSDLLRTHPKWFAWGAKGEVVHPSADQDGKRVVWGDLAQFEHRGTKDKEGMARYFLEAIDFLLDLGFKGFRCDAAYQIPGDLWKRLITETRRKDPDILFLAETLGTTPDRTRKTAAAGFDYIFNSSKWWDFKAPWLMEQYKLTRRVSPSISFPESHDTVRLCEELDGNVRGMKQRYLFTALFSAGVMMPVGFELGFRKKLHVVKTRPEDWESTDIDLTPFVTRVNLIKAEHRVFREEAATELLESPNRKVLLMRKRSEDGGEEALLFLNEDVHEEQRVEIPDLGTLVRTRAPLKDVSPEDRREGAVTSLRRDLKPGQGIVLVSETKQGEPGRSKSH